MAKLSLTGLSAVVVGISFVTSCSGDVPYLGPVGYPAHDGGDSTTDTASGDPTATDAAVRDAAAITSDAAQSAGNGAGAGTSVDASVTSDAGASGLPCNVDSFLQLHCRSCHGARLIGGAPMALLTYADLLAPSPTDSSKTNAQRSSEMMQAGTMPPGGGLLQADLQAFAVWVQGGTPMGSCASSAAGDAGTVSDPYNTPVVCSSNKTWTSGDRGSQLMHPGDACISCHSSRGGGEAPLFALAGTLYPTAHEPNDCNGSSAVGASIVITDANGTSHTLTPNAAGNFDWTGSLAKPYSAKVVYQGRTRAMATKQTDGDCNGCHTESGNSAAPGRIMLP